MKIITRIANGIISSIKYLGETLLFVVPFIVTLFVAWHFYTLPEEKPHIYRPTQRDIEVAKKHHKYQTQQGGINDDDDDDE
jgi:hypothetical protein